MIFTKWMLGGIVGLAAAAGILGLFLYKSVEEVGALENELDHQERLIWSLQDSVKRYQKELEHQQELLAENQGLKHQLKLVKDEMSRRDQDVVENDMEARAWAEQRIPAAVLERLRNP